jgi:hypothetical protein
VLEMTSGVRNRIASFESHNAELRVKLDSPRSSSTGVISPPGSSPRQQGFFPPDAAEFPGRTSETSTASQIRVNRLQAEQAKNGYSLSSEREIQLSARRLQGVADRSSPASSTQGASASLFAHRKKPFNAPTTPDGSVTRQTLSDSKNYIMQPKLEDTPQDSSRRASRLEKIKQLQRHRIGKPRTVQEDDNGDERHRIKASDVPVNTDPSNDDDITLTSVRQIVATRNNAPEDEQELDVDTWRGEEKSQKNLSVMSPSSSSDYETDGFDRSQRGGNALYGEQVEAPSMSASQLTPDVAAFYNRRHTPAAPQRDDDDTYDYSARDEDNNTYTKKTFDDEDDGVVEETNSQESLSYAQRIERKARLDRKVAKAKAAADKKVQQKDGPFMHKEDVEHYRKQLEAPTVKTAAGVAAAATVGCILLGPVGLLVGAAAVGIGVGVMQIPEEQRSNMQVKAAEALKGAQESAFSATEALSNSCANSYRDSGLDEHVPSEMKSCCTPVDTNPPRTKGVEHAGPLGGKEQSQTHEEAIAHDMSSISPTRFTRRKKARVACLRQGKFCQSTLFFLEYLHACSHPILHT